MPPTKVTQADSPAGIVPTPRPAAPWRVVRMEVKTEMRLDVAFTDGTSGEVRMERFLESPRVAGTVFEPLRDPAVFAQARVVLGAVTWPSGADLAPDAMYK